MTDKEKLPYHKIMVDVWRVFIKKRTYERYSDKWWEEIISEYRTLRQPYIGTKLDDYVCQLSQVFLDEYERGQKNERPDGIPEEVLSGTQGRTQEELQLPNPICEVGGFEEVVEPFT